VVNAEATTLSDGQRAGLASGLRSVLDADDISLDPAERLAYGYDNSRRHALPDAVAFPREPDQVVELVRLCRRLRVPVTARGRGTNTTGASVPVGGGLVLGFERMARLIELRAGDRAVVVQPGLLNGELQLALRPHGLFWPPDPTSAPYCSIGGNLACNAGGPRAVKYGASRDNVLGLAAVTGAGELLRIGAATSKSASGYDLSRLLVGSEGTLALIVEATLKLTPLAPARRVLRALYRDAHAAADAVARIMSQPATPSMLEFLDGRCLRLLRETAGLDLPAAGAMLLVEADDATDTALEAALAALRRAADGAGCLGVELARDDHERERLWAARKALSPALRTIAPGKINEDVVVPVSRIPALVDAVGVIAGEAMLEIVCFGHAGNGNLHVNILFDPADAEQQARADRAIERVFEATLALGGLLSGEHGIGLVKRGWMARAFDPATLSAMRAIKQALDPDGILNPGKLLPEAVR
jgi:D-lactate dehydrogenase